MENGDASLTPLRYGEDERFQNRDRRIITDIENFLQGANISKMKTLKWNWLPGVGESIMCVCIGELEF